MGGGISTVSFLFEYYGQLIYGHTPQTISYQAKVGINVVRKVKTMVEFRLYSEKSVKLLNFGKV